MDIELEIKRLKQSVDTLARKTDNLKYQYENHTHSGNDLTRRLFHITTRTVYASGTAYSLTTAAAKVDFGTTDPTITLLDAGTYLILARARIDYNGATFAAVRNVTMKLRRTNNSAADLTGATTTKKTEIITALTYTMDTLTLPPVLYTTGNTNDVIELWGSIDTGPTAGSIDVVEADIVAIRIHS